MGGSAKARTAKGVSSSQLALVSEFPVRFISSSPAAFTTPRPRRTRKPAHVCGTLLLFGAQLHTALPPHDLLSPRQGWLLCDRNFQFSTPTPLSLSLSIFFSPWQPSCPEHASLPRRWHPASGMPSRAVSCRNNHTPGERRQQTVGLN